MKLPFTNVEITFSRKTESSVGAERVERDLRSRFNPIKGLTPTGLARILESFDAGELKEAARLFAKIRRRDDMVLAVACKRELEPSQLPWEILTIEDSAEAQRHKEALEYLYNNIRASSVMNPDRRGGMSLILRQMMAAVGDSCAVHELIWEQTAGGLQLTTKQVPLWFFEARTGPLRFLPKPDSRDGDALEPGEWMVTSGDGLMEATAIAYLFKQMSLKDWLSFSEKFGFPGVIGKASGQKGSQQWKDMVEAVKAWANDFACVVGQGDEIDLKEVGNTGRDLPFPLLADRMDRAIATIWRGGDLSTISRGDDAVGASLQSEEKDLLLGADVEMLTEALREYIDRPALQFLFGTDAPLAYVQIKLPADVDAEREMKITAHLVKHGAAVAVEDELERFERTQPDDKETLLRAPTGAAGSTPDSPAEPGGDETARDRLANILQGGRAEQQFFNAALSQLGVGVTADLGAFLDRLFRASEIHDEDAFSNELRAIQREIPAAFRQAMADPKTARAMERALGSALVDGAVSGALERLPPEHQPAS